MKASRDDEWLQGACHLRSLGDPGRVSNMRESDPVMDEVGASREALAKEVDCHADEVERKMQGSTIVITAVREPRGGWADAARKLREAGGDELLDAPTSTRFDQSEWQW